jgi:OmcA/MtrC family decaheme c-type cytochrome
MNRGLFVRSLISAGLALCIAACSGSDGKNGANGKSCTVGVNDAGASILTCGDTTATLSNPTVIPKNDAGATNCTIQAPDGGARKIVCPDGTEVVIPASGGSAGSSCTVVSNGDGTSTMTCPGLDGGTFTTTIKNALSGFASLSADELAALDLKITITSITVPATGKPVVAFKVTDNNSGDAISGLPPATMRFALLKLVPGVTGGNDTWVSYMAANATSVPSTESPATSTAAGGTVTDNGDGTYVYTFLKNVVTDPANAGTTYDATATHRFAMQVSQSANGLQVFAPVNVVKDFIPATGADVTGNNDKVDGASCLECHSSFRAKAGGTGAFHGGSRYDVRFCVTCHNDQRRFTALPGTGTTPLVDLDATGVVTVDPATQATSWVGNAVMVNGEAFINLPVFIHKIHMGDALTLNGGSYTAVAAPYETTYPQDSRNCVKCHSLPTTFPQANTYKTKPSRRACGSCHDGISFAAVAAIPAGRVAHKGGPMDSDALCAACHPASAPNNGTIYGISDSHIAIADPDPTATNFGGTQTHTNAGWIPAAGMLPSGAAKITYNIKSVSRDANKHPSIVFQFQKVVPPAADVTPVVFNTYDPVAAPEMMTGFVNSPSVYFAYALPQDGIKAPADFNKTVSGYIKTIWNGTAATTGTMTGPDASGFYTITLTATIPDSAVMLTGGVGYSYGTTSTQPLTEIDLPAFPYGDATVVPGCAAGQVCGGLIVAAPDAHLVATGYTGRRQIVDNSTCVKCHAQLGANPSFHAGQRNDASTCAFCHNPNLVDGGWSVSSSTFIHGIHGGSERTVPYTWQAACPAGTSFAAGTCTIANADSYAKLTYPGILNNCQQCHLPGTYDFSLAASGAALPNLLMSTVATGTYAAPAINYYPDPSVVVADNVTSYGTGYLTTGTVTSGTVSGVVCTTAAPCTCSQDAPCNASDNTLVNSPITAACSACHNSPTYIDHMKQMGGTYYGTRLAAKSQPEQCMMCHGPGAVAAIADVHK